MNVDKKLLIEEIELHKKDPKTVFEWMEFFNVNKDDMQEFIRLIDDLVFSYEVIVKDNLLYLGEWENYFHGQVRVNRRGFGFVDFEHRPSVYISKENLKNIYDRDTIVVQVVTDKDEGIVIKVLKRNLERIVGNIYSKRLPVKFIADNLMYENKIVIDNVDDFANLNRHKVLLKVKSFENEKIQTEIIKVLGYMDDPGVDILAILLENNIRVEWPSDVLEEVKNVPNEVLETDLVNRKNLVDELIFTIDGDDAKDLDDAISIKKKGNNYVLGVHIMDVDYYVREHSAIDEEAYKRGTSVYVADRVVSMLPPQLSNGICSLNPHEKRLAMSVIMEINHNGNVVDYEIFESVIESKHRLTYTKVNEVYEDPKSNPDYDEVKDSLFLMLELSDILQARREKLGAIDFDKDEVDLKVNKQGEVYEIDVRDRGIAERLIENFMVTTNETVARLMRYSEWPSIYRIHEKPDPAKMRDFAGLASILGYKLKGNMDEIHPDQLQKLLKESHDSENHFVLSSQLLRSMQKARYDFNNIGHFGLGSSEYSHFTSPIRRYPDLILHRMLKKYFFRNEFNHFDKDERYLVRAADELSLKERAAISAERDVNDMKVAEYMEKHIGDVYKGVISSVHNFGMFVQLDNLVEGLVKVDTLSGYYNLAPDGFSLIGDNDNPTYRIGQRVTVQVIGASKAARNVDFEIYRQKGKNRKANNDKKYRKQ